MLVWASCQKTFLRKTAAVRNNQLYFKVVQNHTYDCEMQKVVCYVDGFNLYHGLRSKGWKKYYWLDVWALAERFLLPDQELNSLVYCSARVRRDVEGLGRQMNYIDALIAYREKMKVMYGQYIVKKVRCPDCGGVRTQHEEKMTDVNIACQMLADAMDNQFDTAFVISGDSDLAPPIEMIHNRFSDKRIIALFPPNRVSKVLRRVSHGFRAINETDLRNSQLPQRIVLGNRSLGRPLRWCTA
jgi:uncharacterized LabA/DUF88 family protein